MIKIRRHRGTRYAVGASASTSGPDVRRSVTAVLMTSQHTGHHTGRQARLRCCDTGVDQGRQEERFMPITRPGSTRRCSVRPKQKNSYAFPAINCTSSGNRPAPRSKVSPTPAVTESSSSRPVAQNSAPASVKRHGDGAVALAGFTHVIAASTRSTWRCTPTTAQGQSWTLCPALAGDLGATREQVAIHFVPVAHIGTARQCQSMRTWPSPRSCSRRRRPPRSF